MEDRWKGWIPLPSKKTTQALGEGWLDISHPLNEDLARVSFFPQPRFYRIMSMPEKPLNVTEIQVACHVGTHVDAPRHFFPDGPTFEAIPLERLYGPGVVWHVDASPYEVIEPDTFEKMKPAAHPGDIVILDTGWAKLYGTGKYDEHPCLSSEAARWLVDHHIKLLGVDFATPDLAVNRRPSGFNWPVHHILLSHGVLVSEHLTNLQRISGLRIEAMFFALNIEGSDGAPARVMARPAPQF